MSKPPDPLDLRPKPPTAPAIEKKGVPFSESSIYKELVHPLLARAAQPAKPRVRPPTIPHFGLDARILRADVESRPDHYQPEQVRCLERVEKREAISEREAIDLMLAFTRPSELRRATEALAKKAEEKPKDEELDTTFEAQDFGKSIVLA